MHIEEGGQEILLCMDGMLWVSLCPLGRKLLKCVFLHAPEATEIAFPARVKLQLPQFSNNKGRRPHVCRRAAHRCTMPPSSATTSLQGAWCSTARQPSCWTSAARHRARSLALRVTPTLPCGSAAPSHMDASPVSRCASPAGLRPSSYAGVR